MALGTSNTGVVGTSIKPVVAPKPVVKPAPNVKILTPAQKAAMQKQMDAAKAAAVKAYLAKPASTKPVPTGAINKPTIGGSKPGGVGNTNPATGGPANPAVPAPVDPVNQYLGSDTTYQSQLAAINKALADYQAQMGADANQYQVAYGQNVHDLGVNRDKSIYDNTNDFAGRGMFHSGLYGKASGDIVNDYTNQQMQFGNYNAEQALAQQRAKQEAINRRALTLKV
jgi:hypothetical protein